MAKTGDSCTFCGRGSWDVNMLINGISGAICDECAQQAYERSCAVLSCVIYSAGLMVIKSYKIYNGVQIAICIVSVLIIYFLAHVDNANNELTKSERKYLRNKVRIFLSSEVVIFVLLLIKANEYWSGIIAISMMIVAILVLAGFIENRIRG